MYKWQVNPNVPTITALRTVMELLNCSVPKDDADAEALKALLGQMLILANSFAQLSLLLDRIVQYSLDTQRMEVALSSALLETGNHTTSISDQVKALVTTSPQSQWILKNRREILRSAVAAQDFVDEGLNYHRM